MTGPVLIGCEESQEVCKAFRALGVEAYSCDLQPCSGGHPEWHLQCDVFTAIKGGTLTTQAGTTVTVTRGAAAIYFPDCTFLTCSAEWAYKDQPPLKSGKLTGEARRQARARAIEFVKALWASGERVSIENPVGVLSTAWMKPTQIIQPWHFGDDASKKTCLWLKGLPKLKESGRLPGDNLTRRANQTPSGQNKLGPSDDRAKIRSKTYPGIAAAMATQWTEYLSKL